MHQRILRLPEVINTSGLSRASIYRGMSLGTFPKAIKISERAIGWPDDVIREWMDSKIQKLAEQGGTA